MNFQDLDNEKQVDMDQEDSFLKHEKRMKEANPSTSKNAIKEEPKNKNNKNPAARPMLRKG